MAIESDRAESLLSGIRHGVTTGAPIALLIPNKDWENWQRTMHVEREMPPDASGAERRCRHAAAPRPRRPGGRRQVRPRRHARRPRARERPRNGRARRRRRGRPPVPGAARHRHRQSRRSRSGRRAARRSAGVHLRQARAIAADAPLHCADAAVEQRMMAADRPRAREPATHGRHLRGDRPRRAGGARQLRAVGSKTRRPAGAGADVDSRDQGGRHRPGPAVADPARLADARRDPAAARRRRAASIRWRGRPTTPAASKAASPTARIVRVTAYMKPIATLMKPLRSVDLATMAESPAAIERSDVCAVPAAAVVGGSDGGDSCSPTRCSRSSAAIRSRRSFRAGGRSVSGRSTGSRPIEPGRGRHLGGRTQKNRPECPPAGFSSRVVYRRLPVVSAIQAPPGRDHLGCPARAGGGR